MIYNKYLKANRFYSPDYNYTESNPEIESFELKDMIDYRPRRHGYESGAGNDITATANVFSPKVTPAGNFTDCWKIELDFMNGLNYYYWKREKL